MLGEKHDLMHEFPEYEERIQELTTTNEQFISMVKEYDEIDRIIRRSELEEEVHADDYIEELKKKRVALKDELFQMLRE